MVSATVAVVVAALSLCAVLPAVLATNAPIIGILSVNSDGSTCDTVSDWIARTRPESMVDPPAGVVPADGGCFQACYVKWLESAGARVVPIPYSASQSELDFLFASVNGILFTGGGLSLEANTTYFQTANYLFQKAIAANDAGDPFGLWGTCQGFQLLNILAAQNHSVLTTGVFSSENISLPLDFTDAAPTSLLYGSAPASVIDTLTDTNCTINFHHDGVEPSVFNSNSRLTSFYDVLSTNFDTKGREFISSIEAKNYPFFGVQYHPERVPFEYWGPLNPSAIDHAPDSIAVAQYLANFFVDQTRSSTHAFPPAQEDSYLIYHYFAYYLGEGQQAYYIQ